MRQVEPCVFLIGQTQLIEEGLQEFLNHIGTPDWNTDASTDIEKISEVYGRICYNSFSLGLNPNLTKIREGNKQYLENILNQGHGSLLNHSWLNFVFTEVSRIFTHELIRHEIGTAKSQESLRYVRLNQVKMWLPTIIRETPEAMDIFIDAAEYSEQAYTKLVEIFKLDDPSAKFHFKKEVTSALRRIAPDGLATSIGWSCDLRELRWVIERRTAPDAEEEIRKVFGKVAEIVIQKYPNIFQDFQTEMADGFYWYKPKYSKI